MEKILKNFVEKFLKLFLRTIKAMYKYALIFHICYIYMDFFRKTRLINF